MPDTNLNALRKLPSYRERREHIFPSEGSLQWFVRQHRPRLIEAGALVFIAGQWHAHEQLFDSFVMRAGEAAAKGHA